MARGIAPRRRRPRKPRGVPYPQHFDATPRIVAAYQADVDGTNVVLVFSTEVTLSAGQPWEDFETGGQNPISGDQQAPTTLTLQFLTETSNGSAIGWPDCTWIKSLSGQTLKAATTVIGFEV